MSNTHVLPVIKNIQKDLKDLSLSRDVLYMGAAELSGDLAQAVISHYKKIGPMIRAQTAELADWGKFPESPIRGKFVSKTNSARVGLNYGPELDPLFMNKEVSAAFNGAYSCLIEIGHSFMGSLYDCFQIKNRQEGFKGSSILTASYYLKTRAGEIGLKAHEDFGLATIGVADQPGLEFQTPTGEWTAVRPEAVLFHVGEWARRTFLSENVNSNPFNHRVVDQAEGRTFLGAFLNPSFSSRLVSDFYSQPARSLSFLEFIENKPQTY